MIALALTRVNTFHRRSHVLFDLGLEVAERTITCLLGRNGAGKTTTMRTIMGLTPPASGTIVFHGHRLAGLRPWQIFRLGVKLVPQGRGIFPRLTVEENLRLAMLRAGVRDPGAELRKVFGLFPDLEQRRAQPGHTLSGGQLQMLAIARALLGQTRLILMDEPTEGLAPLVVQSIRAALQRIRADGVTVLLAEQNVRLALEVGDYHHVIDNGRVRFSGTAAEIHGRPDVLVQYLGVSTGSTSSTP